MPKELDRSTKVHVGFALTVRFLPTDKVPPNPHPGNDYAPYENMWYRDLGHERWTEHLRPNTVIVMDANECSVGLMGSSSETW